MLPTFESGILSYTACESATEGSSDDYISGWLKEQTQGT